MQEMLAELTREVRSKYYGKYRGFVVENEDPDKLGRIKVRVPSVLGDTVTGWALPCSPFGGLRDQGLFAIPEVEAQVWVEFEEGELSHPIWTGTFWQQSGDPPEEADATPPTTRVLKTPSGHVLEFDDEPGEESIRLRHPTEAELTIDSQGTVVLTDSQGSRLVLDADAGEVLLEDANGNRMRMDSSGTIIEDPNGNRIEMAGSMLSIKGQKVVIEGSQICLGGQGGEPLIKGQSFLTLFATHVHTTTAPGTPTSPPIPQGEMSTLSMTTTTT